MPNGACDEIADGRSQVVCLTYAVVSADGKTLTRVVKGVDALGKAFQSTEVYERQ